MALIFLQLKVCHVIEIMSSSWEKIVAYVFGQILPLLKIQLFKVEILSRCDMLSSMNKKKRD